MMTTTILTIALCISCSVEMTKQPIAPAQEIAIVATAVEVDLTDSRGVATAKEAKVVVDFDCALVEGVPTTLRGYPTGFT